MSPRAFKLWRFFAWNVASFLVLCSVALVSAWCICGCTRTTQLQALTAMTEATNAALPAVYDAREAAGDKCFDGSPTADSAKACVDKVRADWRPVEVALDALEALDRAALNGRIEYDRALAVYCGLAAVLVEHGVELPAPILGVCP